METCVSNTSQSPSWWLIAKASFLRPTKTVASMLVQQVDESQSKKTVAAVTEEQAQAGLSPQPNDVFVDFGNCHALEQEVQNFVNVEEVTQELRDAADVRMNLPEDHMSLTLDGLQPDDSIDNTTGVRALVRRGTLINSVSVKGALMANSAGRGPCASWGDMSSAKIARMKSVRMLMRPPKPPKALRAVKRCPKHHKLGRHVLGKDCAYEVVLACFWRSLYRSAIRNLPGARAAA